MIYVASPYSDKDPAVMEQRFVAVCHFAGRLMQGGFIVYSPIIHCHPIATRVDLPRTWDYWEKFDTDMIERADAVMVYCLPGWQQSKGIAAEVAIATRLNKPISYINI